MKEVTPVEDSPAGFVVDLACSTLCATLAVAGCLAIVVGSVFLIGGAFEGASRQDLLFFGAVVFSGFAVCAGSLFLDKAWSDAAGEGRV